MSKQRKSKQPHAERRKPGRPEEKVWPEPIDATPEEVARALMQGSPKKDWRYLRERR